MRPSRLSIDTKQACRDELVVYSFFLQQYILRSTLMY